MHHVYVCMYIHACVLCLFACTEETSATSMNFEGGGGGYTCRLCYESIPSENIVFTQWFVRMTYARVILERKYDFHTYALEMCMKCFGFLSFAFGKNSTKIKEIKIDLTLRPLKRCLKYPLSNNSSARHYRCFCVQLYNLTRVTRIWRRTHFALFRENEAGRRNACFCRQKARMSFRYCFPAMNFTPRIVVVRKRISAGADKNTTKYSYRFIGRGDV